MLRNSVLRTRYRLRSPNSQLSVAGRYESYSTTRGSRRAQEQVSQVPPLLRAGPSSRNDTTRLSTWRDQILLFHATPRREGLQFFPLLAAALKASASLEYVRWATRIALTFVPLTMVKNHITRKYIRHIIKDKPEMAERRAELQERLRKRVIFYRMLLAFPFAVFGLTCLASLERTPLSGRWRLILLSPEEEDTISAQLKNGGWYTAVLEILAQDGPPAIIPPTDWRFQWVNDTLRHLEQSLPVLAAEKAAGTPWLEPGPDGAPLPPPAKHPLRPRPAAKEYLRRFCDSFCDKSSRSRNMHVQVEGPHLVPGPPYNLIIVDRPDCDNAFSFGFGPEGGGGIVVYSGFIDRVLAHEPCPEDATRTPVEHSTSPPPPQPQKPSILSSFLGSLFSLGPAHPPSQNPSFPPACTPTPEQTSQLAILLAHELSHLVLSHHLETLSSVSVVIPGTVSLVADLFRAFLFPFTMFFGPFVNDAVADLGRIGSGEFGKLSEYCTSMAQEFEADAVSARILAHAGFDARKTIDFWEQRKDAEVTECSPQRAEENVARGASLVRRITGSTHPVHEARVARLRNELDRWERERMKAIKNREYNQKYARLDAQDQGASNPEGKSAAATGR